MSAKSDASNDLNIAMRVLVPPISTPMYIPELVCNDDPLLPYLIVNLYWNTLQFGREHTLDM